MNIISLSFIVSSLLLSQNVHALTCEQWKAKLPARFAKDLRTEGEPEAKGESMTLACGQAVGKAVVSYVQNRGKNALLLELAARVGVSGATVSFVMVTGHQVQLAWKAAQFAYKALEADKKCFENHELKRGMLEPIAHFYPQQHLDTWVQNLGCSELARTVSAKIERTERDIRDKELKQKEFEQRTSPARGLTEAQRQLIERHYPAELRTPTENEKVFAEKRAAMEKPIPLLDMATEVLPCFRREAIARIACGFVAETGVSYLGQNYDRRNVGLDPDLKETLLREAKDRR